MIASKDQRKKLETIAQDIHRMYVWYAQQSAQENPSETAAFDITLPEIKKAHDTFKSLHGKNYGSAMVSFEHKNGSLVNFEYNNVQFVSPISSSYYVNFAIESDNWRRIDGRQVQLPYRLQVQLDCEPTMGARFTAGHKQLFDLGYVFREIDRPKLDELVQFDPTFSKSE